MSLERSGWEIFFPIPITEADIRRLTGAGTFARGDTLQRAGHVSGAAISKDRLSARVRGTWQRIDEAAVTASAGQIQPGCSCGVGDFCRHVTALLLQWARQPASFVPTTSVQPPPYLDESGDLDDVGALNVLGPGEETPLQEYVRLLGGATANEVRSIARARGVRVTAKTKGDLVEQCASIFSADDNIDEALATLESDQYLALEAVELINTIEQPTLRAVNKAYRALGGSGTESGNSSPAIESLVKLGLLFSWGDRWQHPSAGYVIPRVVAVRVRARAAYDSPIRRMIRGLDIQQMDTREGLAERVPGKPKLGIPEVFLIMSHELHEGRIGTQLPTIKKDQIAGVPSGWYIHPETPPGTTGARQEVRLAALPAPLVDSELDHLVQVTGRSAGAIEFSLRLLLGLGIMQVVQTADRFHLRVRQDALEEFLGLSPSQRRALLVDAWIAFDDSVEVRMMVRARSTLQLHCQSTFYRGHKAAQPRGSAMRILVASIVGRLATPMEPSPWYDIASLLDLLWKLAPTALHRQVTPSNASWWFTAGNRENRVLNLNKRDDWQRVAGPLVHILLGGPMNWLGLVEIVWKGNEVSAFRVLPTAAALLGLVTEEPTEDILTTVRVLSDPESGLPVVVVPIGSADGMLHGLVSDIGDLIGASTDGMIYRLSVGRVRSAFDKGLTGPDLIRFLEDRSGEALPETVRQTLDCWWTSYGSVRLYDDLTVIELGDEYLLRELLATTSLSQAMLHSFTPRLIAVDPAMMSTLATEFTKLGYTPRIHESPE